MQPSQEDFRAAYRDWKEAREKFDHEMDAIMAGAPHDEAKVNALLDRLDSTYRLFMEAGKPFVGFRSIRG